MRRVWRRGIAFPMAEAGTITALFPTLVYRAEAADPNGRLNREIAAAARLLADGDADGQRWCARHGYQGYTSYGSLPDLPERLDVFARLARLVERHAARFVKALHWEMRGGRPRVDTLWVNVLGEGGAHGGHIHTNAVLSGTYYVTVPDGAGPIVFEDPRHAMMMAAPPRRRRAPRAMGVTVSEAPAAGLVLLWESWLRHEVPVNRAAGERISVSFNMVIG